MCAPPGSHLLSLLFLAASIIGRLGSVDGAFSSSQGHWEGCGPDSERTRVSITAAEVRGYGGSKNVVGKEMDREKGSSVHLSFWETEHVQCVCWRFQCPLPTTARTSARCHRVQGLDHCKTQAFQ